MLVFLQWWCCGTGAGAGGEGLEMLSTLGCAALEHDGKLGVAPHIHTGITIVGAACDDGMYVRRWLCQKSTA